ncbi:MAG: hypothetical protein LC672_06825 [Acidobacteria bacterium]|nr:hypothetical protein [Acidobacteriota bacterium]
MLLKSIRVFIAITSLVSVVSLSGYTQDLSSDSSQWRTSFEAFAKAVDAVPLADVPWSKVEVGQLSGKRVSGERAIMRQFGGRVVFDGVFNGFITDAPQRDPQDKGQKIDISMAWPDGLDRNSKHWTLHLYPKASSLKAWRALKPKTPIKFSADVTGITKFYPAIYGVVHLHGMSILLEEGEIVSK